MRSLLLKSLQPSAVDLTWDASTQNVMTMRFALPHTRYNTAERDARHFYEQLLPLLRFAAPEWSRGCR